MTPAVMMKTKFLLSILAAVVGVSSQLIPTGCSPLELLIARGTGEAGEYGTIVGDPLMRGVASELQGTTAYSVQYPANASRISLALGRDDVIQRLISQPIACPQQKFALIGYSQGATVMHMAAANMSLKIMPRVVAVVMFGDPWMKESDKTIRQFPAYLGSRLLENCATGDPVCGRGNRSTMQAHLTYNNEDARFMKKSVAYIVKAYRGKTGATAIPPPATNTTGTTTTTPVPKPQLPTSTPVPLPSATNTTSATPGNSTAPPQLPNNAPPKGPTPRPRVSQLPSLGSGGGPKSPSDPEILRPPQGIPQTAPIDPPAVGAHVETTKKLPRSKDVLWRKAGLVSAGFSRRSRPGQTKDTILREGWS